MELRAGILLIQSRAVSFLNHMTQTEPLARAGGSEFKRNLAAQSFN